MIQNYEKKNPTHNLSSSSYTYTDRKKCEENEIKCMQGKINGDMHINVFCIKEKKIIHTCMSISIFICGLNYGIGSQVDESGVYFI